MLYNLVALLYIIGTIFGLWLIFKKAGVAPWKSIIPIYNIVVWVKICGKSWKWYVYFLIPAINIFTFLLLVVETAKQFQRNGLLEQTIAVICPFLYLPYLGLSNKRQYTTPSELPTYKASQVREWLDAIIFALVAAIIIRNNVLEFYNIPSSSMEKSLMTGDYLMVSKLSYGPRVSMTPLSIPLIHNIIPGTQCESYLKWIQLPYHRYPGFSHIKRFDATVFNYPDGDTVCSAYQSNRSYHDLVRLYGRERVMSDRAHFGKIITRPVNKKENFIKRTIGLPGETLQIVNRQVLINGKVIENPQDMQYTYAIRMKESLQDYLATTSSMNVSIENVAETKLNMDWNLFKDYKISAEDWNSATYYMYLPLNEQQLQICLQYKAYLSIDVLNTTLLKTNALSADSQNEMATMLVRLSPDFGLSTTDAEYGQRNAEIRQAYIELSKKLEEYGVSQAILSEAEQYYTLPLTEEQYHKLQQRNEIAAIIPIVAQKGYDGQDLFPHAQGYDWSVDNFGPVHIPARGETIKLTIDNLPLYRRIIEVFEHNKIAIRDNKIFINGKQTTSYTFHMNYYWLMGDNRHNSADSRYWGFVPEDHIVGKATTVVWSKDKEQPRGHRIRWNRVLKKASGLTK